MLYGAQIQNRYMRRPVGVLEIAHLVFQLFGVDLEPATANDLLQRPRGDSELYAPSMFFDPFAFANGKKQSDGRRTCAAQPHDACELVSNVDCDSARLTRGHSELFDRHVIPHDAISERRAFGHAAIRAPRIRVAVRVLRV